MFSVPRPVLHRCRPAYRALCVALAALLLSSCSSTMAHRDRYMDSYQSQDLPHAEASISRVIDKKMPGSNYRRSGDAVWLLLDRATTRFAMGEIAGAIDDYNHAIEAIDYYSQKSFGELTGKVILQDTIGAYPGEDFEQILARVYFALALLQQGDKNNAYAILRQSEEAQERKREEYRSNRATQNFHLVDNPVGKYLFGALLEHRGDLSNARILYQQTACLVGEEAVSEDIARLDSVGSGIKKATVIVVCHNGNSPVKYSDVSDASIASGIALEIFLSTQNINPAISSMTGIPVPELEQLPCSDPVPTYVEIDGITRPVRPWYDVSRTAWEQLEQNKPIIVARGVARMVLRRGMVGAAQQHCDQLGLLVDMAMLIANATTKADTRSWATLPSSIDIARFDLEPGDHDLAIKVAPRSPYSTTDRHRLRLKEGDLCIINVFNVHPGMSTTLVPQNFVTQGTSNK